MAPKAARSTALAGLSSSKELRQELNDLLPFYGVPPQYTVDAETTRIPRAAFAPEAQRWQSQPAAALRDTLACPYVGLRNLGATCYVNCLLQYLFVNSALRSCILSAEIHGDDRVLRALQLLFVRMLRGHETVCDPSEFLDSAGLTRGEQEDVTELWQHLSAYLVDKIGAHQSSLPELLAFEEASTVTCQECQTASASSSTLWELRVRFSPPSDGDGSTAGSGKQVVKLEDELRSMLREERLYGDNKYLCSVCAAPREARRQSALRSLPRFLHVVIDRYCWDASTGQRLKLGHDVQYPALLDLGDLCLASSEPTSRCKFELIGVMEHHSSVAESGHYTATLRRPCRDTAAAYAGEEAAGEVAEWWKFNDRIVSKVAYPGRQVVTPGPVDLDVEVTGEASAECLRWASDSAYMLAYRRLEDASQGYTEDATHAAAARLPAWAVEAVDASNVTLARQAADHQRRIDEQTTLRLYREGLAAALPERLAKLEGLPPDELSVVPARWLERWLRGADEQDAESPYAGPSRVDFSDLLLPTCAPAQPLLDPFAMARGLGKVLPSSIVRGELFDNAVLVPTGLSSGDVTLGGMVSMDVCRNVQALVRCTRSLREVVTKLYHQESTAAGEDRCYVWPSALYNFNKRLGTQAQASLSAQPRRGKRAKVLGDDEIWTELCKERARSRPLRTETALARSGSGAGGSSGSSASLKGQAAVTLELGEGLTCAHGRLRPGPKVGIVHMADVRMLEGLVAERTRLWAALGVDVPLGIKAELVPLYPNEVCEICKSTLKTQRADEGSRKKAEQRRREDERRRFPYLSGANSDVSLAAAGKYVLIPGNWRRSWQAYVSSAASPAPGKPDFSALRCQHARLRYDPAAHFYQQNQSSGQCGGHPQLAAYCLVPQAEAEAIARAYGCSDGYGQDWCVLNCVAVPPEEEGGCPGGVIYESSPEPCRECSIAEPLCELAVKMLDMRFGLGNASELWVQVPGIRPAGLALKGLVAAACGFTGVSAGHVLLFVERQGGGQEPLGDHDVLDVLGACQAAPSSSSRATRAGPGRPPAAAASKPPRLLAEVHAVDLSGDGDDAPAQKRLRTEGTSSLLRSKLLPSAAPASLLADSPTAEAL